MIKRIFSLLLFALVFIQVAVAQTVPAPVLETPSDYVSPENVLNLQNMLTGLITILVGYFSALIPGLKMISNKAVRIIVTSLIIVAGAGAFKFGFLTKETFEFAVVGFLPNFGGSAFVYELLKIVLGLFKINIKSLQPNGEG